MIAVLLALLFALTSSPSVSLVITQHEGPKNVHLRYTVTGPYAGRVCADVDYPSGEHAGAFCADAPVNVAEGAQLVVEGVSALNPEQANSHSARRTVHRDNAQGRQE